MSTVPPSPSREGGSEAPELAVVAVHLDDNAKGGTDEEVGERRHLHGHHPVVVLDDGGEPQQRPEELGSEVLRAVEHVGSRRKLDARVRHAIGAGHSEALGQVERVRRHNADEGAKVNWCAAPEVKGLPVNDLAVHERLGRAKRDGQRRCQHGVAKAEAAGVEVVEAQLLGTPAGLDQLGSLEVAEARPNTTTVERHRVLDGAVQGHELVRKSVEVVGAVHVQRHLGRVARLEDRGGRARFWYGPAKCSTRSGLAALKTAVRSATSPCASLMATVPNLPAGALTLLLSACRRAARRPPIVTRNPCATSLPAASSEKMPEPTMKTWFLGSSAGEARRRQRQRCRERHEQRQCYEGMEEDVIFMIILTLTPACLT